MLHSYACYFNINVIISSLFYSLSILNKCGKSISKGFRCFKELLILDSKAPPSLLSITHQKSTFGLGRDKSLKYNVGVHWIVFQCMPLQA